MPLHTSLIGETTQARIHNADARWTMAYAAGINDYNPKYFDNRKQDLAVHPVFPVCLEWPSILDVRNLPANKTLSEEESARGVHASHDLHMFKPLQANGRYETSVQVIGCVPSAAGGRVIMRIDTREVGGALVAQTWQTSVYRDVPIEGRSRKPLAEPPSWPEPAEAKNKVQAADFVQRSIPVGTGLGNVYTETARIFNPIHSDVAYAVAAGLPDIILHGTASLALSISALVDHLLDGASDRVTRLGGRFVGMVLMPNQLTMSVTNLDAQGCCFELKDQSEKMVIKQGFLQWK